MESHPPSLAELTRRYLHDVGVTGKVRPGPVTMRGEVDLYDGQEPRQVDPSLAWQSAHEVLSQFPDLEVTDLPAPPEGWRERVQAAEPLLAVPFCVGNYPQRLGSVHELLRLGLPSTNGMGEGRSGNELPSPADARPATGLEPLEALIAAALLRMEAHWDRAAMSLELPALQSGPWTAVAANERAALAWHRGDFENAAQLWDQQPPSPPVLFNRGMAALFCNQSAKAQVSLNLAATQLRKESTWFHLCQLYLVLTDLRR